MPRPAKQGSLAQHSTCVGRIMPWHQGLDAEAIIKILLSPCSTVGKQLLRFLDRVGKSLREGFHVSFAEV